MTYSYNTSVPATNNNPSTDQPDMLTNTQSINSIIGVDHVSFNTASGGTHLQATFSSKNTPGAQTDPQSVLYTRNGTASTVADMAFRNQNGIFPVNLLRAWALCSSGGVVSSQSINVSSVTRTGAGQYTVNLSANVLTGTNYGVVVGCANASQSMVGVYTIVSATQFTLLFAIGSASPSDPTNFTFAVYQI